MEAQIIQNRHMSQKDEEEDHQILNQLIKDLHKVRKEISKETPTATAKAKAKAKARAKANPDHDTERIDNPDPEFWKSVTLTALRDQLNKRGFRRHKNRWD